MNKHASGVSLFYFFYPCIF